MKIENDPRLTAYALGELGDEERSIFEQELANAGGADAALNEICVCADRLREAYAAEPIYAMTDEQRSALLCDAGALPVPVMIEEEVRHSDKILPWVTQPVISEVDTQKIAEALKPTLWRRVAPVIGSLGVAAGVVWLATVVLINQQDTGNEVVTAAPPEEDELEPVIILLPPPAELADNGPRKRVGALGGLPPFRYGQPIESVIADEGEFLDPSFLASRRSAFPIAEGDGSFEALRRYLAEGQLPPADAVRVAELLNTFDYGYASPADGQTFAVDTELASCPWAPEHQLLQIGVRASESSLDGPVAEGVSMAVEFNPATVAGYRLIGEAEEQSAGEGGGASVASGQSVTALYEVLPRLAAAGDSPAGGLNAGEMVTVRVDYTDTANADPSAQSVEANVAAVADPEPAASWRDASDDFRFAASVASYTMLLGNPERAPLATSELVLELARNAIGTDPNGKRKEFVKWVEKTVELKADEMDEPDLATEMRMLASPPKAPKLPKDKRRR